MRSTRTYSVVAYNGMIEPKSWEESLTSTMGVCRTVKKSYEIALFLSGITDPTLNYRQVLRILNQKRAVEIKQRDGVKTAVIVHTKAY